MAATYKRKRKQAAPVTASDIKLLICVGVFLVSVLLKYTDYEFADRLRAQAAGAIHGGADVTEVMEVFGRAFDEGDLQEVFGESDLLASVFSSSIIPCGEETGEGAPVGTSETEPEPAREEGEPPETADEHALIDPIYSERSFADDLEERERSRFPDTVDDTVYVMGFERAVPVRDTLSSGFGMRVHPITGEDTFHFGLDFAAPEGTPILAFADGTVREQGDGSYGNYLIVDHAGGYSTLYAHCSKLLAGQGEFVQVGQEIAQVGATGNATGNHLHLEIWRDGKALDPNHYLRDL